jgi:hypothetical protein
VYDIDIVGEELRDDVAERGEESDVKESDDAGAVDSLEGRCC